MGLVDFGDYILGRRGGIFWSEYVVDGVEIRYSRAKVWEKGTDRVIWQ